MEELLKLLENEQELRDYLLSNSGQSQVAAVVLRRVKERVRSSNLPGLDTATCLEHLTKAEALVNHFMKVDKDV